MSENKKPTVNIDKNASEPIMVQKGSGRLQCPKCGNIVRNMIRETDDPTHKISDYPLVLAKKYKCGKCGVFWKRAEE